jgi:hypothetical protein
LHPQSQSGTIGNFKRRKETMTVQSFIDALNMKEFPQLGYVLVQKEKGLFWEFNHYGNFVSYPANQETRDDITKNL